MSVKLAGLDTAKHVFQVHGAAVREAVAAATCEVIGRFAEVHRGSRICRRCIASVAG